MNIRMKQWWLPVLFMFDFIYYYFIQHLTTPQVDRLWVPIRIEGFIFVCIISLISVGCVQWVKTRVSRSVTDSIPWKYLKILFYSFLLFILATGSMQFFLEYASGQQRDLAYVIGNGLTYVFLHIVVGNAYIAMEYFRESAALQQHLIRSEKAKYESELKVLQQQMSPHFLFNNLNTLASLIPQDQNKAVNFTHGLSNILRYVSQNAKKDLITLTEELRFLDQYMELMTFRFGDAYVMKVEQLDNSSDFLVVPLALQVAVENVFKHNSGSRTNPLEIIIRTENEQLFITNEIREKKNGGEEPSGIGLTNLKERYYLLTGRNIETKTAEGRFEVILPLIKHIHDADLSH